MWEGSFLRRGSSRKCWTEGHLRHHAVPKQHCSVAHWHSAVPPLLPAPLAPLSQDVLLLRVVACLALAPFQTPIIFPGSGFEVLAMLTSGSQCFLCSSRTEKGLFLAPGALSSSGIPQVPKSVRQNISFLAWCSNLSCLDYPKIGCERGTGTGRAPACALLAYP